MDFLEEMKEAYKAVADQDWNFLIEYFSNQPEHLLFPMNFSGDSAFHLAVHSKKEKPLKNLLKIAIDSDEYSRDTLLDVMLSTNTGGNTVLHEAATVGNLDVIRLLLCGDSLSLPEDCKEQLKQQLMDENMDGELPLFTAAAFGQTEIVEFLVGQESQMCRGKMSDRCRRRSFDHKSILQIAIEGEHFETTLVLLKCDESLVHMKDEEGKTAFHYLAKMPTSFRSGYTHQSILDQFIYLWLPVHYYIAKDKSSQVSKSEPEKDLESGKLKNPDSRLTILYEKFNGIKRWFHKVFAGWCPRVRRIWEQKRKHKCALALAKKLAESLTRWEEFYQVQFNYDGKPFTELSLPLFIATENGIVEIVKEILHKNPQSAEYENNKGQNILHLAVIYRRNDIFNLLEEMKMPWVRMTRKIDNDNVTLLHRAADTSCYYGGTRPGPALQLQEELLWFERVKRAVPSHYELRLAKRSSIKKGGDDSNAVTPICCIEYFKEQHRAQLDREVTPIEHFKEQHQAQLKEAQDWIKGTSQSCSTVAGLVATVVFAAAYTVPGGTDERGFPIFLHSPFFQFFTVMDVIALACSLTSVVAFLSILTSPFEFGDFRRSIPAKLYFGFILLFFSVITTMLAFGSTILLTLRSDRHWSTSFISFAAFLPVSVFVLLQFRLYWTLITDAFGALKKINKILPRFAKRKLR